MQAHVRFGTAADLEKAVAAAQAAQPAWAATNPQRRARVMFEFKRLVESEHGRAGRTCSRSEHGKVIADSRATSSAAWK